MIAAAAVISRDGRESARSISRSTPRNGQAIYDAFPTFVTAPATPTRGNVILPPELPGNPEAIFEVVQLPTGEIIDVQLRKSSGVKAYDEAVQRAILKSSPLPRPDRPEQFQRALSLKFRPLD